MTGVQTCALPIYRNSSSQNLLNWFQSLFWWNFVWGRQAPERVCRLWDVSILVLVEFRLGACSPSVFRRKNMGVSILVLVEFRLGDNRRSRNSFFMSGFNPCSGGISSGGIYCLCHFLLHFLFQSLFWWNFVWGLFSRLHQSIQSHCFNPCSGGMSSGEIGRAHV